MSYQKLNLDNGDTLLATHLQHIENGIESAHIRQPLIFTGAVSAMYDGGNEVTVQIPYGGGSGSNGTGFNILMDFTTTENVTEFQVPIDTTEIAERIKGATTIYIGLDIPRDTANTETSTVGTVDVFLYASWKQTLFAGISVISPPSVTWAKNGRATMKFENIPWGTSGSHQRMPIFKSYAAYIDNYNSAKTEFTCASINPFAYVTKDSYFIISGSQSICAGTRFVVGVI